MNTVVVLFLFLLCLLAVFVIAVEYQNHLDAIAPSVSYDYTVTEHNDTIG